MELVLYYSTGDARMKKQEMMMKSVLVRMGVKIRNVATDQVLESVGYLAAVPGFEKREVSETLETAGRENWVEYYQTAMELVQNISAEMPLQGDFAAWADQMRQSEAFAQLVALGDDALIYCLMQMPGGTDTESYVVMLAAYELAYGSR